MIGTRNRVLAFILLAAAVLALPFTARAGQDAPLPVEARKAAFAKALYELDIQVANIEELSKAYPGAADLEAVDSARQAARSKLLVGLAAAQEMYAGLDALGKGMEQGESMRLISTMSGMKGHPSRDRRKAASLAIEDTHGLNELLEFRRFLLDAKRRFGRIGDRLRADDEAFARQREARAEVRRLRRDALVVLALVLLATAVALLRRLRA